MTNSITKEEVKTMSYDKVFKQWSKFMTFPCKANSKIPATPNGYKGAILGQDVLNLAQKCYNVGLALSMSNLICIDCDVDEQKAYNGLKTLEEKEKELGKLPTTLTQTTPRGGKHFIFSSKGIINAIGKIGKDIDVKFNGYILISPSIINGKRYVITDGINDDGNFVIADLPQVWLDYINKTNCMDSKAVSKHTDTFESKPKVYKNIDVDKILNSCAFLKFCKDNAEDLSEPMWHSMITILAQIEGSDELIHTLSEPYHNYSFVETQKKIDNARQFGYPQSCKYLSDNYPDVCKSCYLNTTKKEENNE